MSVLSEKERHQWVADAWGSRSPFLNNNAGWRGVIESKGDILAVQIIQTPGFAVLVPPDEAEPWDNPARVKYTNGYSIVDKLNTSQGLASMMSDVTKTLTFQAGKDDTVQDRIAWPFFQLDDPTQSFKMQLGKETWIGSPASRCDAKGCKLFGSQNTYAPQFVENTFRTGIPITWKLFNAPSDDQGVVQMRTLKPFEDINGHRHLPKWIEQRQKWFNRSSWTIPDIAPLVDSLSELQEDRKIMYTIAGKHRGRPTMALVVSRHLVELANPFHGSKSVPDIGLGRTFRARLRSWIRIGLGAKESTLAAGALMLSAATLAVAATRPWDGKVSRVDYERDVRAMCRDSPQKPWRAFAAKALLASMLLLPASVASGGCGSVLAWLDQPSAAKAAGALLAAADQEGSQVFAQDEALRSWLQTSEPWPAVGRADLANLPRQGEEEPLEIYRQRVLEAFPDALEILFTHETTGKPRSKVEGFARMYPSLLMA